MKKIFIIIFITFQSLVTYSQKKCFFCDTLMPYKHCILLQANRTFSRFCDIPIFLLEKITGSYDKANRQQSYIINLRYGYRVHKNIEVGPELIYNGYTSKLTNENNEEYLAKSYKFKAGIYSRFIMNRWQVFKPYADIGLGYFLYKSSYNESYTIINKFDCYSVLGISFMIWKNHINIDLGAKYSPIRWSNVVSKKVVFTWKIGYNFNARQKN